MAATQRILQAHGNAAPPIIALTASVSEEDQQRSADAGMCGFLSNSAVTAAEVRLPSVKAAIAGSTDR